MLMQLRQLFHRDKQRAYQPVQGDPALSARLSERLQDSLVKVRQLCGDTADLQVRPLEVCGISTTLLLLEGMVSLSTMTKSLVQPLTTLRMAEATPEKLMDWMNQKAVLSGDQKVFTTYQELFDFLMAGFVVVLVDGLSTGVAMGIQGFSTRSVSEPSTEVNVRGSQEGFVENVRTNMSLIRRRMKSPTLRMELGKVGQTSRTDYCLVYRSDLVSQELLRRIRHQLTTLKLDVVLESGYLQPFLDGPRLSFFSGVGVTERPDTMCAKVSEGRVGIMVDGTPFALVVPYLFNEYFQSMDDYAQRPYYATFIRWLKYIAFFVALLLPGLYVAIATFHPELFPEALLFNVATSEQGTPFPLMLEALLIHFLYEIMREAGLRLPKAIGHAVSIVGALVIGDAAVTAGLISTPMVLVVALTAISAFVVPSLYEPVAVLRFVFILLGGSLGLFGIVLGLAVLGVNLCSVESMGVPVTSPSSPLSLYTLRDTLFRWSWRELGEEDLVVTDLPGSALRSKKGDDLKQ